MLDACASRVGGRLAELLVKSGDLVTKGQVVARLDATTYRLQRDEAIAGEAAAQAEFNAAQTEFKRAGIAYQKEIAIAKAEIRAAQAKEKYTKGQFNRLTNVASNLSKDQLDQAHSSWDGTEAALDISQSKLSLLINDGLRQGDTEKAPRELEIQMLGNKVKIAESKLELARTKRSTAEDNLSETEIKAPEDGQISRRHADLGQVLAPGQKIFTISVLSAPWIEANFEEGDIAGITEGALAKIKVDAFPGRIFSGHVQKILGATLSEFSLLSSGASSGNFIKVTQRVPVTIAIDDQDLPILLPGLNASVRVETAQAAAQPRALKK
jgi:membrane fusion protein (multidrug efflux system)